MVHSRNIGVATALLLVVMVAGAWWLYTLPPTPAAVVTPPSVVTPVQKLLGEGMYQCDNNRFLSVSFYDMVTDVKPDPVADVPSTPTGFAVVSLDGSSTTVRLPQTISADGGRYALPDESLVVWTKGQSVLVLERDVEATYRNCLMVAGDAGQLPNVIASSTLGVTARFPEGYRTNETYTYNVGTTTIPGIRFEVGTITASGTNLAQDSGVSVESLPLRSEECFATAFLANATATAATFNDVLYSYATATDAGAGNRYEERIFVREGTDRCVAIRYFIHSHEITNYDPGTVAAYDERLLLSRFDAIRDSVVVR